MNKGISQSAQKNECTNYVELILLKQGKMRRRMKEKRSAVYEILENGIKERPYCTHCWEAERKTISLIQRTPSTYDCPHCNITIRSRV